MEKSKKVLVTGAAGFIGFHLTQKLIGLGYNVVGLDNLNDYYDVNLKKSRLAILQKLSGFSFEAGDLSDESFINQLFTDHSFEAVIHLAAESHVDRSILDPLSFVKTNVIGTAVLLNAAKRSWKDMEGKLFYHVSTDEVYGSLGETGFFTEETSYDPRSPYSASKASSDHLVSAYYHTYGLPMVISNCSNNYGSHQFPEKLLPLMINNIVHSKPLPVYGKGENVRDWLWVNDHARAIDVIFHQGRLGETYNIGGFNEWKNIDIVHLLCSIMDKKLGRADGESAKLITYVKDRAGHDMRYAIDATKLNKELGWEPSLQFEEGMDKTIDWYLANEGWIQSVTSGSYKQYYEQQYTSR